MSPREHFFNICTCLDRFHGTLVYAILQVEIKTAADVQSAFEFARETGTLLSIKNTGHDFIGRSVLKNSLALYVRLPLLVLSIGS